MPRIAGFLALGLMLVTGYVIGQLQQTAVSPPPAIPAGSEAPFEAAAHFYGAANALLETGDAAALRAAVAPDFVDHGHLDSAPGSLASLERYLLSLRATSPGLRLMATEVAAGKEFLAVRLVTAADEGARIAGLAVTGQVGSEGHELLRVDSGRVTERWASPALPPLIEPAAGIEGIRTTSRLREPRLDRVILAPGAELHVDRHSGAMAIGESGSAQLRRQPGDNVESGWPPDPVLLEPGTAHAVPPDVPFVLWSRDSEPATVLLLRIVYLDGQAYPAQAADTPAVEGILLGGGAKIRPSAGPLDFEAVRVSARPGTAIPLHAVDETEMLLVVLGQVEAAAGEGVLAVPEPPGALIFQERAALVPGGLAVSAGYGATTTYRVTGSEPAEFWLFTIRAAESSS